MTLTLVLSELQALASRLGVDVRTEAFPRGVLQGHGGLCWVNGKALVVMDAKLALPDRIAVLADALVQLNVELDESTRCAPRSVLDALEASRRRVRRVRPEPGRARPRTRYPGLARTKPGAKK